MPETSLGDPTKKPTIKEAIIRINPESGKEETVVPVPVTKLNPFNGQEESVTYYINTSLLQGDPTKIGDKDMGFTPEQEAALDANQGQG